LESPILIFEPLPEPHNISTAEVQGFAHMIQVIGGYWA